MFKMKCPVCKMKMNQKLITKYYECTNCESHLKLKSSYCIKYIFTIFMTPVIGIILAQHVILPDYDNNLPKFILPITVGLFSVIVDLLLYKFHIFKLEKI